MSLGFFLLFTAVSDGFNFGRLFFFRVKCTCYKCVVREFQSEYCSSHCIFVIYRIYNFCSFFLIIKIILI